MLKMELQNFFQLEVKTFDPSLQVIKVTVTETDANSCKCDEILHKLGKVLGLKKESFSSFTICHGYDHPLKRFNADDSIPVDTKDLSLHKWCFELKQENDLIHKDPAATHLIFCQAKHRIRTGQIKANDEIVQKLEDCLDPDFPADGQYIKLCQSLPTYNSVLIQGCVVCACHKGQKALISERVLVDVTVSHYGIKCVSESSICKFTWYDLMKWTVHLGKKTVTFIIKEQESEANYLPLYTEQLEYLLSVMSEMFKILQKMDIDCDVVFHTEMIQTMADGSTKWTNGFYDPEKAVQFRNQL